MKGIYAMGAYAWCFSPNIILTPPLILFHSHPLGKEKEGKERELLYVILVEKI
jgi:hypothetical protein